MLNTIIKLLDAGYTKEEIQQMIAPEKAPAPEQKTEEKPAPAPENKAEEKPVPEEKPAAEPFDTQPFTKAIDEMSKAMDAMNIKLQRMALDMYERPGEPVKTVESIIAKIVDPNA